MYMMNMYACSTGYGFFEIRFRKYTYINMYMHCCNSERDIEFTE